MNVPLPGCCGALVIMEDHTADAALLDCSGVRDTCFVGVGAGAVVMISSCA